MSEHYFTSNPESAHRYAECDFTYRGHALHFRSDAGVFSRGEVDAGTRILLEALPEALSGRVLDLGCGWGPVGVSVGKMWPECDIVMSDVNERALGLAAENAARNGVKALTLCSDGLDAVDGVFDCVITNPPIRAGKQVIYRLFHDCVEKLTPKGELYIVIRKQQGAESALKYLKTIYKTVDTIDKSGGFWVIRCRKGTNDEVRQGIL